MPGATIKAYADDIAIALPELGASLRPLQRIFLESERLAGIGFNIRKTVLIPLGEEDLVAVGSLLFQRAPGWAGLPIQYQATYLGFVMGPGRGTSAWSGPFKKVRERAELWSDIPLGLHLAARAFNVYILSTCQFVAQSEPVPDTWKEVERRALAKFVRGPGNWCRPEDLRQLRTGYRLPCKPQWPRRCGSTIGRTTATAAC